MAERVIPQRDLRNNVGEILRAAEAGQSFTITVRGRPVARLVPPGSPEAPRVDVDRETIRAILAEPIDAADLEAELDAAEAPVDLPD
jgi:prevent-host-death family protein